LELKILSTNFINNNAKIFGGAIYIWNDGSDDQININFIKFGFENLLFENNTGNDGGSIYF
jgi:predicted outer membrane repeat protein